MAESILIDRIKSTFRDDVLETSVFRGEVTHVVTKRALKSICHFVKSDPDLAMNYLVDILGVDYLGRTPRFEVVYHLYSIPRKLRLRLKVRVEDGESLPTVTDIWRDANWVERETYDMFGIVFEGHPGLKRIYLPEDWDGFPLRKDFPLRGFKDRYNPFGEERE